MQFHRCAGMLRGIVVLVLVTIGFGCSRSEPGSDVESQPVAAEVPAAVSGASEPAVEPELPSRPDEPSEEELSVPAAAGQPQPAEEPQAGGEADTGRGQKVVIDGLLPPGKDASKPGSASVPIPIDAVVVVAEGVGLDPDGALKNAFVQAVRQVVGAYVDAETLVKNDQLVHDKVLTFSRGLVSAYQKISERKRDGLIRVTIRATVRHDKLVADLNSVNIETGKFPGPTLFARLSSQLKSETDAAALFAKALYRGLPESVVAARLVGKPKVVKQVGEEVALQYDLHLSVDRKRYRAFAARVVPVLEQVASEKGEVTFEGRTSNVAPSPDKNVFSYLWGVPVSGLDRHYSSRLMGSNGWNVSSTILSVWDPVPDWVMDRGEPGIGGRAAVNQESGWAVIVDSNGVRTHVAKSEGLVSRYDDSVLLGSSPKRDGKPTEATVTILINTSENTENSLRTFWRWYRVPWKIVFPDSLMASFFYRLFVDETTVREGGPGWQAKLQPTWRDDALYFLANRSKKLVTAQPGWTKDIMSVIRDEKGFVIDPSHFRFDKNQGSPRYNRFPQLRPFGRSSFKTQKEPGNRAGRPWFWKNAGRGLVIDVVFSDGQGKEVLQHRFPIAPLGSVAFEKTWILSPYVFFASGSEKDMRLKTYQPGRTNSAGILTDWGYSTGMTVSRTMTMKLKDLKSLANVKVTVRRNYAETAW